MSELIIYDGDTKSIGTSYRDYARALQIAIDSYTWTMKNITEKAVMSGSFKEALECLIQYAAELHGEITFLGNEIKTTCNNFIEEIDEKDDYLY